MKPVPLPPTTYWVDPPRKHDRRRWGYTFLLYVAFVVYGSLVPFEWRPMPLETAVARFADIRFLELGAASRADWIANIVLYVPLAFLACVWALGLQARGALQYVGAVVIVAACLALAVAIEFAQLFFAPRTVSLNDLLAEMIGTLLGVLVWVSARWQVFALGRAFAQGGRESVYAALVVFTAGYVLLSLFPYDFVVSPNELAARLDGQAQGWLVRGCDAWIRCAALWAAEAGAVVPFGLILSLLNPRLSALTLFAVGLGVGLVLESLQLLLLSGQSQALSILLRGLGMAVGAELAKMLMMRIHLRALARWAWRAAPFLLVPYLSVMAALAGWVNGPWLELGEAFTRLGQLSWIPFYYHYWTSEPVAMASLLSQVAMYMPIGLAIWAKAFTLPTHRRLSWAVALVAFLVALLIEGGKLLAATTRPDPTNLIIAPLGALLAYWAAGWLGRVIAQESLIGHPASFPTHRSERPESPDGSGGLPREKPRLMATIRRLSGVLQGPTALPRTTSPGLAYAALFGTIAFIGVGLYPIAQLPLAVLLSLYGVALWRFPWLILASIPAAVPILDLSPLTGRLLLNELDLVILVSLAVVGARLSGIRPAPLPNLLLAAALILLWLTWLIATAIGLSPALRGGFPVSASHTPLDAWFVGKGLLWALLLVPLVRRLRAVYGSTRGPRLVLHGTVLGLAWACVVIAWERHVFVGLFDFDSVFRVTGPFASMNTGGAYIEAFLAFGFPMLLIWIVTMPGRWSKWLGVLLVPTLTYAMLVTFSRGGYGALAVGGIVLLLGLVIGGALRSSRQWIAVGGLVVIVSAVALPVLSTGFAQERLSRTDDDLRFRMDHWRHAIELVDGLGSMLLGEGFGRYADLYLFSNRATPAPGTYAVIEEDGNRFLRLGKGEPFYLDQWAQFQPDTDYELSIRLRSSSDQAELSIVLCEKALLYSLTCRWTQVKPIGLDLDWVTREALISTGNVGRRGNWPYGPVKLSLHNSGRGVLDVDDVSLVLPGGSERIANGDFEAGAERWLFLTDQHPAWHIDQKLIEIYVAQGLLGLVAIIVLLIAVAQTLFPKIRAGHIEALAFAAGLAGFLAVGFLGSTVDAPRTAMLFYFSALAGAILIGDRTGRRGSARQGRGM